MTIYENDNANAEQTMDAIRAKFEETKKKARAMFFNVLGWISEHPVETAAIVGTVSVIANKADKLMNIRRGERLRNSMIYDRSLGMYWETKKPLTANQRLLIEARHKAGESYGQLLSDMKVLKR